ncbi:hypothetical protein ACSNOB_21080 [Micromonospora sp. URMC 106]|uniref:hypothetical protein n=1 Tax=Micromonospora sp. URMC 106 TaxID=3423408 RepID=UPI003F1E1CD8
MRTATVTAGRWARLLLLVGTLLGLAAMHTLGHGSHAAGHAADTTGHAADAAAHAVAGPHGGASPAEHTAAVPYAVAAALSGVVGCPGDCPHERLLPFGGAGGGPPWWGVCLAVLGALAASLLAAVLLLAGVPAVAPAGRASGGSDRSPRAPPPRRVGLRLATVSVLRR